MPDPLQQLADRIRAELPASHSVEGRWTPATMALLAELTDAVEAEGPHPRRMAEIVVTGWLITQQPIRECIASEVELELWRLPAPTRGKQGFAPVLRK